MAPSLPLGDRVGGGGAAQPRSESVTGVSRAEHISHVGLTAAAPGLKPLH